MVIKCVVKHWLPVVFFVIAFTILPFSQLNYLSSMPGDVGDASLLNYFLENVYQFFFGGSDSLWHLRFFSPFPYVLGFSENLFGSAPVYVFARLLTAQSDTAYQVWFLFGYAANFGATYYALRRLGGSSLASSVGALIFAFALPTTAHAGHAQLHYRAGVPLALTFFILFLERKEWRLLTVSSAWLVWQFYCGIYIGFFTLLLAAIMTVIYLAYSLWTRQILIGDFIPAWRIKSRRKGFSVFLHLTLLLIVLAMLFYPYLQVSQLYAAERSWDEIVTMLPRPQSYLLSDSSYIWSHYASTLFTDIPMRHEHQMFMGAAPIIFASLGVLLLKHKGTNLKFVLLSGALGAGIILTLCIHEFSIWYFLHRLPLASAVRAMTRIDQVLLFPIAYLAAVGIDQLRLRGPGLLNAIWVIGLPLMVFEFSATSMGVSAKEDWRGRLMANEAAFPKQLTRDKIVFFAQNNGPFYADELDAMWVSLKHGVGTLNGYSGLYPPGFSPHYGRDCSELPKRVLSYLSFSDQNGDEDAYVRLMQRVVPIGFEGCDKKWLTTLPQITISDREYSVEEVRNLAYRLQKKEQVNGQSLIELKLLNFGNTPLAAQSGIGKPLRVSWRFLDVFGKPVEGWETRKDLPFDIPAQGDLTVRIFIDPTTEVKGGFLEISLVQESVFWAHDIGVPPLTVRWD